eukprot:8996612-Alexandrium_andersonii.AAC.1
MHQFWQMRPGQAPLPPAPGQVPAQAPLSEANDGLREVWADTPEQRQRAEAIRTELRRLQQLRDTLTKDTADADFPDL